MTQLIPVNANFESALAGSWFPQGSAVLTQDATHVRSGSNAMKIVTTAAVNDGAQYDNQRALVTPFRTYTCSCYVWCAVATSSWYLQLSGWTTPGLNNTGTVVNFYNGTPVALVAGQWTAITNTVTFAANEVSCDILIIQSTASVQTVWVDDMWMTGGIDQVQMPAAMAKVS